ncbi:MAG: glutamate synthase subunit beta [Leptospiraceae bacterium]|nr:glutamate synthase subunit beta [Leptospiraceae bacterium]
MGKVTGFKEINRHKMRRDPVEERILHYSEFEHRLNDDDAKDEGARCMDCGIPFCHSEHGCPVDNLIPEWNDLVYRGHWKQALDNLHSTNNFPEFTGRLCPAPCESACTLGITNPPVHIKSIERAIIDNAYDEGWVEPMPAPFQREQKIAIIGGGPAGMACAQQLVRAGYQVTLFEKNQSIGGLMRYGIPDFKMEKWRIERRVQQMRSEGLVLKTGVHVGLDISVSEIRDQFDVMVLAGGSEQPRDLPVPGRELRGVHFAMDFLTRQNRIIGGEEVNDPISARGKHVIVIGGGDTGSDCVGTSRRQGASSITQIELFPEPPAERTADMPWPTYPRTLKTSSSHEEGCERKWAVMTKGFKGNADGQLTAIFGNEVKFERGQFVDIPGTEFEWPADLVFLAMGFVHPVHEGMIGDLQKSGLELDARGNVKASFGTVKGSFQTTIPGVFSCGDMRRGQSLIVWAISEGRKCAAEIHRQIEAGLI